ncbi:MAG: hypothetical protein AAF762_06885, partial [Pseudomonadota bacterium]
MPELTTQVIDSALPDNNLNSIEPAAFRDLFGRTLTDIAEAAQSGGGAATVPDFDGETAGLVPVPSGNFTNGYLDHTGAWQELPDAGGGPATITGLPSVANLAALPSDDGSLNDGDVYFVRHRKLVGDGGGGRVLEWSSSMPKAAADGGMIIDPDTSIDDQLAGNPATSGTGCWVGEPLILGIPADWYCGGETECAQAFRRIMEYAEEQNWSGFVLCSDRVYSMVAPISIPPYVGILGAGGWYRGYVAADLRDGGTRFYTSVGFSDVNNTGFYYNLDVGGASWKSGQPINGPMQGISYVNFMNSNAGTTYTCCRFAGSFYTTMVQAENVRTVWKGQSGNYSDRIHIDRTYVKPNQYSNSDNYLIDINMLGDGLEIISPAFPNTVTGVYGIRVNGPCRGGKVFGQINGDLYINRARAFRVEAGHYEGGAITVEDGHATLVDNAIFMGSQRAGEAGVRVIASTTTRGSVVTLDGNQFQWEGDRLAGYLASGAGHSLDPDLLIGASFDGQVVLRNNRRIMTFASAVGHTSSAAIQVEDEGAGLIDDWTDYGWAEQGAVIQKGKTSLTRALPGLAASPAMAGLSGIANFTGASGFNFQGTQTTYFYRLQLLYDPRRMIGVT